MIMRAVGSIVRQRWIKSRARVLLVGKILTKDEVRESDKPCWETPRQYSTGLNE